jgi:hypothetical protein
MTVNIVKTKFAADIRCFEVDDVADDEDAEEVEADIRAMTKQRNHGTRTANRAYANQQNSNFGNVWDGLIRHSLRASALWRDFWKLETLFDETAGGRGSGTGTGPSQTGRSCLRGSPWASAGRGRSGRRRRY